MQDLKSWVFIENQKNVYFVVCQGDSIRMCVVWKWAEGNRQEGGQERKGWCGTVKKSHVRKFHKEHNSVW